LLVKTGPAGTHSVLSILHRRSLTELITEFLLGNSLQMFSAPFLLLANEFNRRFILVR